MNLTLNPFKVGILVQSLQWIITEVVFKLEKGLEAFNTSILIRDSCIMLLVLTDLVAYRGFLYLHHDSV